MSLGFKTHNSVGDFFIASLKHIFVVAVSTLGSRVFGLLRDIVVFAFLGVGVVNSAFIFAYTLPNLFRRLLGEGALSSALIPAFSHEMEENGLKGAYRFLNQVCSWVALLLVVLVGFGILTLWGVTQWEGLERRWYLGAELGMLMMPYMLLVCLAAVMGAVLNTMEDFAVSALSQIWLNVSMILSIAVVGYFFGTGDESYVYYLCGGVLVGGVIQLIVPAMRLIKLGWKPCLDWGWSPGMRSLVKLFLPGLMGAAVLQLNIMVSRLLAFWLNDEAVSVLYLANRLIEFPLGVFTIAVATVLFPGISKLIAQGNLVEFGVAYRRGVRLVLSIAMPAMVGLIVMGGSIFAVLFEWGHFKAEDVALAVPVLSIFALGLPFYSMAILGTRGLHAMKDMKLPFRVALLAFGLNFIFSILLIKPLGVWGLASANVLSAGVQGFILDYYVIKRASVKGGRLRFWFLKVSLASVVMGVVAYAFVLFGINSVFTVAVGIPVCVVVYLLILKLVKVEEVAEFRRRWGQGKAESGP